MRKCHEYGLVMSYLNVINTMQKGTDLELREGRLTGLNSTGILLNYMK